MDNVWKRCYCDLRSTLYLEHVRLRGAWRYSAFGTRIFPKVLYEIEGSHNALLCLLRSVVFFPVLHLIVDSYRESTTAFDLSR